MTEIEKSYWDAIEPIAAKIAGMVPKNYKVTIILRPDDNPKGQVIITEDDLDLVVKAIHEAKPVSQS